MRKNFYHLLASFQDVPSQKLNFTLFELHLPSRLLVGVDHIGGPDGHSSSRKISHGLPGHHVRNFPLFMC